MIDEQRPWPEDLALHSLRHAAAEFVALDTTSAPDDLPARLRGRSKRSITSSLLATAAEFVLCDLDYEALDFALHVLGPLASRCTYLNATIPRVLRKLVPFAHSTW
jgi:hypothetical protein